MYEKQVASIESAREALDVQNPSDPIKNALLHLDNALIQIELAESRAVAAAPAKPAAVVPAAKSTTAKS